MISDRIVGSIAFSLILCFTTLATAQDASQKLTIDSERSSISFVSEAPAEKIVGTADNLSGQLQWDLTSLQDTSGSISFPVQAMKTGNRLRDRHLQGKDWLDAKNHPKITYTVTSLTNIQRESNNEQLIIQASANGTVSVRGIEKETTATLRMVVLADKKIVRIQPTLTIRLADHQVAGKRGYIGDKVGEKIEIEGLIYGQWE